MQKNGYGEFRSRMRQYRNKEKIGITTGRLTNIKPLTIKVEYSGIEFEFDKFKSLINMDNMTEEDIGTEYTVQFTDDNQSLFVIGEIKYYDKYNCNN